MSTLTKFFLDSLSVTTGLFIYSFFVYIAYLMVFAEKEIKEEEIKEENQNSKEENLDNFDILEDI